MPVRQFWATQHAVRFVTEYTVDLTRPTSPPRLRVSITDQEGAVLGEAVVMLPPTYIDDAVQEVVKAGWHCYLYGEPSQLKAACKKVAREWWDFAEEGALTR